MQQPTEITRVALDLRRQVFESARVLVRCGILLATMASAAACTGNDRNTGNSDSSPVKSGGKSTAVRVLRRGLPGEPRTLDPQLAEDTFSFPVLRDLYEGLTTEILGSATPNLRPFIISSPPCAG